VVNWAKRTFGVCSGTVEVVAKRLACRIFGLRYVKAYKEVSMYKIVLAAGYICFLAGCTSNLLYLDQTPKQTGGIQASPLSTTARPAYLSKLAFGEPYFRVTAHVEVDPSAQGTEYCGFKGNTFIKQQAYILISAKPRGIRNLPDAIEVPIYLKDTTKDGDACGNTLISDAEIIPYTLMDPLDNDAKIDIFLKYRNIKEEDFLQFAAQASTLIATLGYGDIASQVTQVATSSLVQRISRAYTQVTSQKANDMVSALINYDGLKKGVESWTLPVNFGRVGPFSSQEYAVNNPKDYGIINILKIVSNVTYMPSVFTPHFTMKNGKFFPNLGRDNLSILTTVGTNDPRHKPTLQQQLDTTVPSASVDLAQGKFTACQHIRNTIDSKRMNLMDRAAWYNAALRQVNSNWGEDYGFLSSECAPTGERDYPSILEEWFGPGYIKRSTLVFSEMATDAARTFTTLMATPMSKFSRAMSKTDDARDLAAAELAELLSIDVTLTPHSRSYGPLYDPVSGKEGVIKVLTGAPVEAIGCHYQEGSLPSSEGSMILYVVGQSKPVMVTLKYDSGSRTFEKICLNDLDPGDEHEQAVQSLKFLSNSVCETKIKHWFSNPMGRHQISAATKTK
jgi:hypothetical protein